MESRMSEQPQSKEELYKIAQEKNLMVCGDPEHMDKETGVDSSHVAYLEATGQIQDTYETLGAVWPTLWPTIEQLLQNLAQSGKDNDDIRAEVMDWRGAYSEVIDEVRIVKKFMNRNMHLKNEFTAFRKRELKKLEADLKKRIIEMEEESENARMSKEEVE